MKLNLKNKCQPQEKLKMNKFIQKEGKKNQKIIF